MDFKSPAVARWKYHESLSLKYSDGVAVFNNLKTLLKFSCELNPDYSICP